MLAERPQSTFISENQEPLSSVLAEQRLAVEVAHREADKRELVLNIGPMAVKVIEIPAAGLNDEEWSTIQAARQSYFAMWGGNSHKGEIEEDPFDGREEDSPYTTHHYLASVDMEGEPTKFITMRKVIIRPDWKGEPATLPDDLSVWSVRDRARQQEYPLWDVVLGLKGTDESVRQQGGLRVAAISRTGTFPYDAEEKKEIQRERTAVAFAAIQLLAADTQTEEECPHFLSCMQCPEFPNKVLSIYDKTGNLVKLDFATTESTLALPPEYDVVLDNDNPKVQMLKTRFPGYWQNNETAATVLMQLVMQGRLRGNDLLKKPYALLVADISQATDGEKLSKLKATMPILKENIIDATPEELALVESFLRLLTKSRNYKHAISLLTTEGKISPNLTGDELRDELIRRAGDGPYSSLLKPDMWRSSALNLLLHAKEKYE